MTKQDRSHEDFQGHFMNAQARMVLKPALGLFRAPFSLGASGLVLSCSCRPLSFSSIMLLWSTMTETATDPGLHHFYPFLFFSSGSGYM